MKNLQIFMTLAMISILQNQQTFTAEQDIINVEKVETMSEAAPVAVVAEVVVPVVEVPATETSETKAAQVIPAATVPVVVVPAVQSAAVPVKVVPQTETPAAKDYAEAAVAFKKIGAVGYNVLQRTAQDVYAVIVKAVEIVKDMSQDLSRSIHQFIAEKSEKKDSDKPEDKVVTQTYRGQERREYRQNKNNDNEQTISWIPEYAYEQTASGEIPYVAGYEEVTN